MAQVSALPATGGVVFDTRDDGRSLRVEWHPNDDLLVLSTWRGNSCVATCHISRTDAVALIGDLVDGLAVKPAPWTAPTYGRLRPRWRDRWHLAAVRP